VRDDTDEHGGVKPSSGSSRACFNSGRADATVDSNCDICAPSNIAPSTEGSYPVGLCDEDDGSQSSTAWKEECERILVGQPVASCMATGDVDGAMLCENSSADFSSIAAHMDNAYSASCCSSSSSSSDSLSQSRRTSSPNNESICVDSCGSEPREAASSPDSSLLLKRPPSDAVTVGPTEETPGEGTRVETPLAVNSCAALESIHVQPENNEIVAANRRMSQDPDDATAEALVVAECTVDADRNARDLNDVNVAEQEEDYTSPRGNNLLKQAPSSVTSSPDDAVSGHIGSVTESADVGSICTEHEVDERPTATESCTNAVEPTLEEIRVKTDSVSTGVSTDCCVNGAASAVECDESQFSSELAAATDPCVSQHLSDSAVGGETDAADQSKAVTPVNAVDDGTSEVRSSTLTSCGFRESGDSSVLSQCEGSSVETDRCASSCSANTSVRKNKSDSGVHSTAVSRHGNEEHENTTNDETSDWHLTSCSSRQTSSLAGAFAPVRRNLPGYGARHLGPCPAERPTAANVGSVPAGGTDRQITMKSGRPIRQHIDGPILCQRSPELAEPRAMLTVRLTSSIIDIVCLLQRLIHVGDVMTRTLCNDSANAEQRQEIVMTLNRHDQNDGHQLRQNAAVTGTNDVADEAHSSDIRRSDAAAGNCDTRRCPPLSSSVRIRQVLRQRLVVVSFFFSAVCFLIFTMVFCSLFRTVMHYSLWSCLLTSAVFFFAVS
jgi:hypothetical protein